MTLREKIIHASFRSGACHIGSALSCSDIIEAIYEVKGKDDIFLFAKASGIAALYCCLHPLEKAWKYLKKYPLPNRKVPGVIWSGGSLGQGLSVATGIALSKKLRGEKGKVYCLISDGELQEGQTWEAIMFAQTYNLNLIVIVDYNGLQSLGRLVVNLNLLTNYIDGHNKVTIKKYLQFIGFKIFVVKTIKGRGVDFMENNNDWHYNNLDKDGYKKSLLQITDK